MKQELSGQTASTYSRSFIFRLIPALLAVASLLWLILRSGSNIKRLTYPCQQASLSYLWGWVAAVLLFVSGSVLLRKLARYSVAMMIIGLIAFLVFTAIESGQTDPGEEVGLPTWQVSSPVSTLFVLDSIPATTGSLAVGNASVPDEFLSDPAIDSLLSIMATNGQPFYKTATTLNGIVGSEQIVIIKANYQWDGRNTTNNDRIKGLIWRVLNHPDGFTGEVLVCDNTQGDDDAINENCNNSEDLQQSILDVISTFAAKGYPVYSRNWNYMWEVVVNEYSQGDIQDGYTWDPVTMVSYPKFTSPSGNYRISLKHGVWDESSGSYDRGKLCLINFPVVKAHGSSGATIGIKNWIGVLTTGFTSQRYGNWNNMHDNYFFGPFVLVAKVMAETFPDLTVVDGTWTSTRTNLDPEATAYTAALVASTDPVAASWYSAKYILNPVADTPEWTDPEPTSEGYGQILARWHNYLANVAGFPCTMDSSRISVFGSPQVNPDYSCGIYTGGYTGNTDCGLDGKRNLSDITRLIDRVYLSKLSLCDETEGNIDGDPENKINLSDITRLIDHVYLSKRETAPCQ